MNPDNRWKRAEAHQVEGGPGGGHADEVVVEKIVKLADRARDEARDLYDIWYLTSERHVALHGPQAPKVVPAGMLHVWPVRHSASAVQFPVHTEPTVAASPSTSTQA